MIKSSEIKQIARTKLSGKWGKAFAMTAIYVIISIVLSYCTTLINNLTTGTKILYYSAEIIVSLLLLPLSFGLTSAIIKLINGKNPQYTTLINDALLNFSKTIEIFFRIFLKMLIPSILVIIVAVLVYGGGIYWINNNTTPNVMYSMWPELMILTLFIICAVSIALAIISLPYSLSKYALANNNELSAKEAVNESIALMKGNKWNFVKLILSFIGWILLLCVLIGLVQSYLPLIQNNYTSLIVDLVKYFGIGLLLPYIYSSISVFYDEVKDVKVETIDLEK